MLVTDCHVHVFDPTAFPYQAARKYTPPAATLPELATMHARIGVRRAVLVQPSVYGTDNRCLVNALERCEYPVRGIAVIDDATPDHLLDEYHTAGVRGIRINLKTTRSGNPAQAAHSMASQAARVRGRGWTVELNAELALLQDVASGVAAMTENVVIDHFGNPRAEGGLQQPGFSTLLALAALPHVYVKLSAPYVISSDAPDYQDIDALARALVATAQDRVVWGSNWPHTQGSHGRGGTKSTDIEPFRDEDDAHNFAILARWVADAGLRRKILADNAGRLFGFE